MAPVNAFSNSSSAAASAKDPVQLPDEARVSVLTTAGESLFMCSSKEGHVCYHACRGHGRYPLWSDDTFMEDDDVVEEEEDDDDDGVVKRKRPRKETSDDEFDIDEDEEWLSQYEDEQEFWEQIQESARRERQRRMSNPPIHYAADELIFMDERQEDRFRDVSANSVLAEDDGPIVGVISTKPPPEYVWHLLAEGDAWMRGSLPQRISEQPENGFHRYRYHAWDRIPSEDIPDSSDEEDDEFDWEAARATGASWSDLADRQEEEQQSQVSW
ncbi:uncharacterized protein [Diadema antillarum]|uniref:uncharacterized protein n=1 Tax=Diadema antillarum TaxID=105358 RepID=UPI003A89B008